MAINSYRDLAVWQRSLDLVTEVYGVVKRLPREERYELGSQLRRAVVSVPANIAEGCGRSHTKEFLHHLSIARGSLAETETLLIIAVREGFVDEAAVQAILGRCDEISRMISGPRTSSQRRLRSKSTTSRVEVRGAASAD